MAEKTTKQPLVAVVMGSDSDLSIMRHAILALKKFNIPFELAVISAHRSPDLAFEYARSARSNGIRVIIGGAGGAAHLPGVLAALTELPVIGVPIATPHLQGQDSLFSIVQMPRGVPVATVAINNAWNAGVLAAQIIAAGGTSQDLALLDKIRKYKQELRDDVLVRNESVAIEEGQEKIPFQQKMEEPLDTPKSNVTPPTKKPKGQPGKIKHSPSRNAKIKKGGKRRS